jgi:hypothetical protein
MSEEMSLIEKETRDQIKAHTMAQKYYYDFKKQFEHIKITEFQIYDFGNTKEMHIEMPFLIEAGWQPLGQPFFQNNWLYVPMVKYE